MVHVLLIFSLVTASPVIQAGREGEVRELVQPHRLDQEVIPGVVLDGIAIGHGRIRFTLCTVDGESCAVALTPRTADSDAAGSESFLFHFDGHDGTCRDAGERLLARVALNDPGEFWDEEVDPISGSESTRSDPTRDRGPWRIIVVGLWGLFLGVLGFRVAGFRGPWPDFALTAGLFAASVVAILLLAPRGPGDGHLNLFPVFLDELNFEWGPAPVVLFQLLGRLVSLDGGLISTVNLFLAAGVTPLLHVLLRRQGFGPVPAALAAGLVGLSPLLLVSAGSLNRQPPYLVCGVGGLALAVRYLREGKHLDLAGAAAGLALAALSRPEGAVIIVVAGLWAVVDRRALPRSLALGTVCAVGAAAAAVYLSTAFRGSDFAAGHDLTITGWWEVLRHSALMTSSTTPTIWLVLWGAALVAGLVRRRLSAALALVTVLGLTIVWTATPVGEQFAGFELQVASLRYQALLLVPLALGLALFFDGLGRFQPPRGRVAGCVVAGALALAALVPTSPALRPTVIDHEYRFLARELSKLPAGSRICILQPAVSDVGFNDANLVSTFVGRPDIHWEHAVRGVCPAATPGVPAFYYRGSWCAPVENQENHRYDPVPYAAFLADCRTLQARHSGAPEVMARIPAVRWAWYDYVDDEALVGLYRLSDD